MTSRFFLPQAGSEPPEKMDVQKVVKELLMLRDHFKSLKALRSEEDAPFYEREEALKQEVMRRCNAEQRNNQRTNYGTAYLVDDVSITMAEPDSFRDWVREGGHWDCAEIRASKTGVEDYVTDYNELPPGLRREVTVKVNVKRNK